jgi:hypothetical protein
MADLERLHIATGTTAAAVNTHFTGFYECLYRHGVYAGSFTVDALKEFSADCLQAFEDQDRLPVRWENQVPNIIGEYLEEDQLILRRVYTSFASTFDLDVAERFDGEESVITKDAYFKKISKEISIASGKKDVFFEKLRSLDLGVKLDKTLHLYLPEGEHLTVAEFKILKEKVHACHGVPVEVNTRQDAVELMGVDGESVIASLRVNTEDIPEGFFTSAIFNGNLQHLDLSHNQAAADAFFAQRSPVKQFSTLTLQGIQLQEGWFLWGLQLVIGLRKLDLRNCDRDNVVAQFRRPNHSLPAAHRDRAPRFQCLEELKISFEPTSSERGVLDSIICGDSDKVIKTAEITSGHLTKSAAKT